MIKNLKNSHSFWNWQGNKLDYPGSYIKYLTIGTMFLLLFFIFIFKNKIQTKFSKGGKILFFKSDIAMWQTIGIIGLLISTIRIILFITYGYPRYWENLQLHFCRIHLWIIFAFLATKKIEWFKYIFIMSIIGSMIGIIFSVEQNNNLNENQVLWTTKTNDTSLTPVNINVDKIINNNNYYWNKEGTKLANQFEVLAVFDNFQYYKLGLDSFIIYDITLSHIFLACLPLFIFVAYKTEFKIVHLLRTQIMYLTLFFFLWIINIGLNYVDDIHWRSNIWYVGVDRNNDFKNIAKPLTQWPQNFFIYAIIGIIMKFVFYFLGMQLGKINFYEKGTKFLKPTIEKYGVWKIIKKQFNKDLIKEIFWLNKNSKKEHQKW